MFPHGTYQDIADSLGISYDTVSKFLGGSEVRTSADTELRIIERAMEIVKTDVLGYLEAKRKSALSKKEAAMAA